MEKENKQTCRICGCTQNNACTGGCYWVEEDLCSACEEMRKQLPGLDDDKDTSARAYSEMFQQKEYYETGKVPTNKNAFNKLQREREFIERHEKGTEIDK